MVSCLKNGLGFGLEALPVSKLRRTWRCTAEAAGLRRYRRMSSEWSRVLTCRDCLLIVLSVWAQPFVSPVRSPYSIISFSGSSGSVNSDTTRRSELIRVPSLVEGCDYKHWLVLMRAPNGFPTSKRHRTRVHEPLTCKIRSLPDVRWVLPDSFLVDGGDSGYGESRSLMGRLSHTDDEYHADWLTRSKQMRMLKTN
ncbi:Uncharacterized protein Rs2_47954 [Raphanus sativus]|nr:Uncharacterized protein Rs2_47954 [Raphanus sativus]